MQSLLQNRQARAKSIKESRQQAAHTSARDHDSVRLERFKAGELQQICGCQAVESQFCSVRGTFIPIHSAKVTSGSQR